MYVIIMVEDRSLIVQADAGQRVKNTAVIWMGLLLLHELLLPLKFEKGGRVQINAVSVKGNPAYFYIYDVLGYK